MKSWTIAMIIVNFLMISSYFFLSSGATQKNGHSSIQMNESVKVADQLYDAPKDSVINNISTDTSHGETEAKAPLARDNAEAITSIKNKYHSLLIDLQTEADNELDNLIQEAVSEYQSMKDKGKTIPYFDIYAKYSLTAKSLEKRVDASFYRIYQALISELKVNGFSTSYARTMKEKYEELKEERRAILLRKVTNYL